MLCIYKRSTDITADNAHGLHQAIEYYKVDGLKRLCETKIPQVSEENSRGVFF
jgi:hypothetical protein